ncbi:MAG: ATP-binding protein [Butyrivibrio sp.]|jgi:signal transduction histidine kinase/CheY-like chemotaxis protein|nr:ATP-binding protein [Butyrivibrio sp.]
MTKFIHPVKNVYQIIRFTIILALFCFGLFTMALPSIGDIRVSMLNGSLTFTGKDICLLLLTGLCGYIPGVVCVFIAFIYRAFTNIAFSYIVFVYLLAVLVTSWFSRRQFIIRKRYILLSSCILALLFGDLWWFVTTLAGGNGFTEISGIHFLFYFIGSLPECLFSMWLVSFLLRRLPDRIKKYIPMGRFYLKSYSPPDAASRSRLSMKITAIIAAEAVILSISATLFANFLIPTLESDVIVPGSNAAVSSSSTSDSASSAYSASASDSAGTSSSIISFNMNTIAPPTNQPADVFRMNNHGIAFDVKLFMLLMNVVIPISILTNYYAQRKIARPIHRIAKETQLFSTEDNEDLLEEQVQKIHDLDIRTGDEIESLYHSVENTADATIDHLNRIRKEQKLEDDLKLAKSANEAKSAFLSNMSHEIRTPINAVLGMDEMILREYDDPTLIQYATSIQTAGRTLLSLVNDILDFSKIEAGKMEILPVEYELSSMINDLINMISVKAADKNLELKVDVNESTPHLLFGDDVRIKQCILNILTNAVKYTEKGSVKLEIGYVPVDDIDILLKVRVTDTGIGIKEDDLKKLFSPFERIEETRNRTIEGTGLGMSIVKQLLSMMGTQLSVASEYGKGSDFSFELKQKVIKWDPIGNFTLMYQKSIAASEKYHESFHAPQAKILVVDDTEMNLTVIRGLLKKTQLQIDTAASGKETLEKVTQKKYDLIFIDHRMPEMDGIETLHAMQALDGNLNRSVPCIALTANAIAGAREMYLSEGFHDYLSKPIDGKKLEQMLMDYLPAPLVIRVRTKDPDSDPGAESAANLSEFDRYQGLDIPAAIQNCGSPEVLRNVIPQFVTAISSKAGLIEQYALSRDYHNYTIQVHALKSSARLIGALELSAEAAYLESCGNEENAAEIESRTPALLALYRSYLEKLSAPESDNADDKPEISPDELSEILGGIREFVDAFDFDSADEALHMLDQYRIPTDYEEKCHQIRQLLCAVDRDNLLKIL